MINRLYTIRYIYGSEHTRRKQRVGWEVIGDVEYSTVIGQYMRYCDKVAMARLVDKERRRT